MRRSFAPILKGPAAAGALLLSVLAAAAQPAGAPCGDQVQVREGDSLSSIAERCGITEGKILDLNPKVQGSKDLRPGMTLSLAAPSASEAADRARDAASGLLDRLKSYAQEASRSIEGAAESVTSSVEDFIKRNPDLHQSVRKLGQRLNIPGMDKVEAQVSLSVRKGSPGTPVTLSAIGLPANQRVEIGGGPPDGDYAILESARTSPEGTLQVTVQLPKDADPNRDFIFVVASPDLNVAARSATFDVVETTAEATRQ